MRTLPDPAEHDPATALGTLLAAAIDHLTATAQGCCPRCCTQCNALYFYWATPIYANVADTAVALALQGQNTPWVFEEAINWPYLIQFWPDGENHQPTCQPDRQPAGPDMSLPTP